MPLFLWIFFSPLLGRLYRYLHSPAGFWFPHGFSALGSGDLLHSSRRLEFLFLDRFTVLRDKPTSATLLGLYIIFLLSLLSRCLRVGTLPEGLLVLKAYSWKGSCMYIQFSVISLRSSVTERNTYLRFFYSIFAMSAMEPTTTFRYQLYTVKYWISLLYTVLHFMHLHLQRPRSVQI